MALNPKKNEMPTQEPLVRARNFNEVALGYTKELALDEAARCLNCKNRPCVAGCPVNIDIPEFIMQVTAISRKPTRSSTRTPPCPPFAAACAPRKPSANPSAPWASSSSP